LTLAAPPRTFAQTRLALTDIDPEQLFRISRFASGEPYFGTSGGNRFDDPHRLKSKRFGTCYFGLSLRVAFAETVLHDEVPVKGRFTVPVAVLESRHVVRFAGSPLRVVDLTGVPLKLSGADGSISSVTPYDMPQKWSAAIHKHPQCPDGFLYMSRHVNSELALVLFDRAMPKLQNPSYTAFPTFPGALQTVMDFKVNFT
jgi:hypothetical protein